MTSNDLEHRAGDHLHAARRRLGGHCRLGRLGLVRAAAAVAAAAAAAAAAVGCDHLVPEAERRLVLGDLRVRVARRKDLEREARAVVARDDDERGEEGRVRPERVPAKRRSS